MLKIQENLSNVKEQIKNFATSVKRAPEEITLLAVSKTKPVSDMIEAYQAGQRFFGESYAQEAAEKITEIRSRGITDIEWHFIGPVQANKTRIIAENFDVVESLDRARIAKRLNDQRPPLMPDLRVLIQVNISREPQKSGVSFEDLPELLDFIDESCPRLKVAGLMGIAENVSDKSEVLPQFRALREVFDRLSGQGRKLTALSMGMTDDMAEAIACGSTEVRIGTAIFGARQYHV